MASNERKHPVSGPAETPSIKKDFSANFNQNGLQKLHGCFLVQLTRNMQGKKKATMQYNLQHKVKVDDKKL